MAMERARRYKSGVARWHETIFDGDGEGERGREDIRVGLRDGTDTQWEDHGSGRFEMGLWTALAIALVRLGSDSRRGVAVGELES